MLTPANRKGKHSVGINSTAITIRLSVTVQTEFQSHNFFQIFFNIYFNSWGWVRLSPPGTLATAGVSVQASDDKWTKNIRWNWNCAGQVYSEETCPNVTLCHKSHMTWPGIEPVATAVGSAWAMARPTNRHLLVFHIYLSSMTSVEDAMASLWAALTRAPFPHNSLFR
jgi:hypothetical protein